MIQITAQMRVLVAIEPVDGRKGIVNGHQVVRLRSGLGKAALQKLIERLQVLQVASTDPTALRRGTCPVQQT